MNLEMARVQMIGLKRDLHATVRALYDLGVVHIDDVHDAPDAAARPLVLDEGTRVHEEDLRYYISQIEGLLESLPVSEDAEEELETDNLLETVRLGIKSLKPQLNFLLERQETLERERDTLPRYASTLRKILPIVPDVAEQPGYSTAGILSGREHTAELDEVREHLLQVTDGEAEVVSGELDETTLAMLVVYPAKHREPVEELLGERDVSRLRLPDPFVRASPRVAMTALEQRLDALPEELEAADEQLKELADEWGGKLRTWHHALNEELERFAILSRFGETEYTFVVLGWVPIDEFERLKSTLQEQIGESISIERKPLTDELKERAPVVLQNPRPVAPFERLVALLNLPRYDGIDPTGWMALFFPIFFGMILGDAGYGAVLLLVCLSLLRRFRTGILRDVLAVLAMGSGWAILFGFLYGEVFGTLGEHLGLHPLWFDRAAGENITSLLLLAVGVGVAHVTLGLVLGVWEAIRERSRSHLLERGGMLLSLIALFLLVGTLAEVLPAGFRTPAIAGLIVGVVILSASLGWIGVVVGPIEFIGLIGNILSYLRIAAIGLASVFLARVANEVAGIVGSLVVGVIVAVLIHALNVVLGAFSPTIHSLRLHYVEFFRKFYEGGGRPYQPFSSGEPTGATRGR